MTERRSNRKPARKNLERPPPRLAAHPEPGLYAMKWGLRNPEMAVAITHGPTPDPETGEPLDRSWYWACAINGVADDPSPQPTERVWLAWHNRFLRPIDREEYDYLVQHRRWARQHAPETPEARPRERLRPAQRSFSL